MREYPATVGQRLLWMMQHYRPGHGALNCPVVFRLRGPLAVGALRAAVADLVARHDALRTTFRGRGARLVAHVAEPGPVALHEAETTAADLDDALAAEHGTRLDPTCCPVRVTLWHIGDEDHALSVTLHHLVTDAWSCGVLANELRELYGHHAGRCPPPPPVRGQYGDFARWQQEMLASTAADRHRRYWLEQLADLELPALPRTGAATGPGVVGRDVPEDVVTGVAALARARHCTPFAVLLAAYDEVLHRVTGQADLAVGSLFAGRMRPEQAGVVGFLSTMVVLRVRRPPGGTLADLLARAHATVIGALAHQDLPYHVLPQPATSGRVDDVVFHLMADPGYRRTVADVEFELLVPEAIGARFSFELAVVQRGGGHRAVLFFRRDWVDDAWASAFLDRYLGMLRAMVTTGPSGLLDEL